MNRQGVFTHTIAFCGGSFTTWLLATWTIKQFKESIEVHKDRNETLYEVIERYADYAPSDVSKKVLAETEFSLQLDGKEMPR